MGRVPSASVAKHMFVDTSVLVACGLLWTASTPAAGFAQTYENELVDERIENFARQGLFGRILYPPFEDCAGEFEQQLLAALFAHEWDQERRSDLIALFRGLTWELCPSPLIDRWLVAQVPHVGASPFRSEGLLLAIAERNAPSQTRDFLEIGANIAAPESLRARALAMAGRRMGTEGRVNLYVEWLERPDVPLEYVTQEGILLSAGSPSLLLDFLSSELIMSLEPEVAMRLVPNLRGIVSQINGASVEESARARQLLDDAAREGGDEAPSASDR